MSIFFPPKRNKNLFVPVTKLISLTSLLHFESNEHKLSMALGLGADGVMTPCALKYQYAILPRWTSQHMTNHDALAESHRFGVACAARPALTARPLRLPTWTRSLFSTQHEMSCPTTCSDHGIAFKKRSRQNSSRKREDGRPAGRRALRPHRRDREEHHQQFIRFAATCSASPGPDGLHPRHERFRLDSRSRTLTSVLPTVAALPRGRLS